MQLRQSSDLSEFDAFANADLTLSQLEIEASAMWMESLQLESGLIPWHSGGHIDPWNHIESVVALAIGNREFAVRRALDGLLKLQNRDGSFCHFYLYNGVKEADRDPNVICYLGVGILAIASIYGLEFVSPYSQMLIDGVNYVLSIQRNDGLLPALVTPDGSEKGRPLRAANCSIMTSLDAAIVYGEAANFSPSLLQSWRDCLFLLRNAYIGAADESFAATDDWAMDWYYPVLAMAGVEGADLQERFSSGLDRFFDKGLGIRCKASNSWYTAAETAEASIAALMIGDFERAREIYETLSRFRAHNGGYMTGIVEPQGVTFPPAEQSSYTTAAVVIASSMLARGVPFSNFTDAICSLGL